MKMGGKIARAAQKLPSLAQLRLTARAEPYADIMAEVTLRENEEK